MLRAAVAAALAALLLALGPAAAQDWKTARATYYGGPDYFTTAFDKARGVGSFGILTQGSCGFTNSDGSLPFPRDSVAAAADANADYAGSCNRCYLVRCRSGVVLDNDGAPLNITEFFYLPSVSRSLRDTSGRAWPGNDGEAQGVLDTRCWDESKELFIRIIDTCPCKQVLPDGAPGVAPGGEVRRQGVCCGGKAGIEHFDISFFGFEELAHPLYGQQMLQYRPVDCNTRQPVGPNYIDKTTIYGPNGAGDGWGWFVYQGSYYQYAVPEISPGGGAGTCVELAAGGGLTFQVKRGSELQPFGGATALAFSLRAGQPPPAPAVREIPDLKIFIVNEDHDPKAYCNAEVFARGLANSTTPLPGGWLRYTVPFSAFRCDYDGALPTQVDRIDFQNPAAEGSVTFCLADLDIIRDPPQDPSPAPQDPAAAGTPPQSPAAAAAPSPSPAAAAAPSPSPAAAGTPPQSPAAAATPPQSPATRAAPPQSPATEAAAAQAAG